MWKTAIDQALADPNLTTFERQVLSDYQVTDAEYQEARDRFRQCMADQGWIVTDMPDGRYLMRGAPGTANENQGVPSDVQLSCESGSTDYIEPIYLGLRDNPAGVSRAQEIRACFESHGVPDGEGMSDDQFEQLVSDPGYHASTPEGKLCYFDPTGSQGMTIEQAEDMDADTDGSIAVTSSPGAFGVSVGVVENTGSSDGS